MITRRYDCPCGELTLAACGNFLCMCDWTGSRRHVLNVRRITKYTRDINDTSSNTVIDSAMSQLDEYFRGERREFDLPLLLCGTDFQKLIWDALRQIPYGQTLSYSELAHIIGRPASVRAVATACGANALSIILPCHRVIGFTGLLTGYAGGLEAKRALLTHEHQKIDY